MPPPHSRIRVLLVDDHALVREGFRMLLDAQSGLDVVGEASTGKEAIDLAQRHRPDIVLMDVTMPGMGGIEATREIVRLGLDARILGLTVHENAEYFFRMLAAGASGYVLKGATSTELVEAIRAVHEGGVYLSPAMAGQMVSAFLRYRNGEDEQPDDRLTPREREVLQAIARGLTNQEVADELHLSVHTIQTHRAHIMRKLGLGNRFQLMKYAFRMGYVDVES